jgi:GH25 family lysozyme M1 (1,4-beta-N-acetylmuramidase)
MKKGIDVSKWQGDIDWEKVKNDGIEFAMIRHGYGFPPNGSMDEKFIKNISEITIPYGVYHFSYAENTDDAKKEADFCLNFVNQVGTELSYPIAYDLENVELRFLGKEVLTQNCIAFCEQIKKAGFEPMIYTNVDWIENRLNKEELFPKYKLWLAQWNATEPKYNCHIWQYSSIGKVDGISTYVDLNYDYTGVLKPNQI